MGLRLPITDPGALLMEPTPASAITKATRYAAGVLVLAAAYYAAGRVGLAAAAVHGVVSSMWPPAGIALFALLRFGMRFWPGVAIGAFVLNATSGVPVGGALGIGAGNAIEALAGYALLTRVARFNLALDRTRDVVALAVLAAFVSPLLGATIGVTSLIWSGAALASTVGALWPVWWSGDAVGVLVVTPFLLTLPRPHHLRLRPGLHALDVGVALAIVVIVAGLVFEFGYGYAYAVYPAVTWAAFRGGQRSVAVAVAAVALIATWGTLHLTGPFGGSTPTATLFLLQLFLGLLSITGLVFAAALSERRRAEHDARDQASQLKAAQQLARMGSWNWDIQRDLVTWSPELYQIYGVAPGGFDGTFDAFLASVHAEDRARVRKTIERAATERGTFTLQERIVRPDGETRVLASTGEADTDAAGALVGLRGICRDITEQWTAEQSLAASEGRFRLLVDAVNDYAIFMLDTEGRVASWNAGAERITQFTADDVLGRHVSMFHADEGGHGGKSAALLREATTTGRVEDKGWRLRKDGSRFFADVVITAVRGARGELTGFAKVTRDATEQRHLLDVRRRLLGQLISAQEDERRRIAREIHDEAGQSLTALQVGLRLVQDAVDITVARSHAARLQEIADGAMKELGALAHGLHPTALDDHGLEPALVRYAREYSLVHGIAVDVHANGLDGRRLPQPVEVAMYRIVVEALTNVARHSRAQNASISLRRSPGTMEAIIEDDGTGFDVSATLDDPEAPRSLGLYSMRERASVVDGLVTIDSGAGQGTTVAVRVPLRD